MPDPLPGLPAPPIPEGLGGGAAKTIPVQPEATLDPMVTLQSAANKQYGFLKNHHVQIVNNPKSNEGYAETWPANEPGSPDWQRPQSLPLGVHGVEVKGAQFSPDDYAAEVFSHIDPKGIDYAHQLQTSLTPDQLSQLKRGSKDYQMSIKMGMPEGDAIRNASMAAVRGYVFNQWPKSAIDELGLSKHQKKMLETARSYAVKGETIPPALANAPGFLK